MVLPVLSGCAKMGSAILFGGRIVEEYVPQKILVDYEAQGEFPEGSQFYLIETESGLAFYEKDTPNGIGMICEKFWYEDDYINFSAAYFGSGIAYIYKVPLDRTKNAERYVYEKGTYQGTPGDRLRPMPFNPKEKPDAILIPKKIYDPGISETQADNNIASGNKINEKSARIKQLEILLSSKDSITQRDTARKLYRSAEFHHPDLLEIIKRELIKGYNQNLDDGNHVDSMAWLCKLLGASGNKEYKKTLEEVAENSQSRKIRRYAEKSLKNMGP